MGMGTFVGGGGIWQGVAEEITDLRKEKRKIIMHSNCILDSVANFYVRHMVFVGNVQKSPIAPHLKGLDPSLDFWTWN